VCDDEHEWKMNGMRTRPFIVSIIKLGVVFLCLRRHSVMKQYRFPFSKVMSLSLSRCMFLPSRSYIGRARPGGSRLMFARAQNVLECVNSNNKFVAGLDEADVCTR
jgi:hypothetical protein